MNKTSEIIKKIIKNDQKLEFYMANKLINLSQFALYIKPLVNARTDKEINIPTIKMALSRIQKKLVETNEEQQFKIKQMNLHKDLCTYSFDKSAAIHKEIQALYNKAMEKETYFTISESNTEITIISKKAFIEDQKIPRHKYEHTSLSAITIKFDPKYLSTTGLMTAIMQKLTMQDINFIEIGSTCTELTCYIDQRNLKLAFNTLHDSFF